jgi:hypothetical protein
MQANDVAYFKLFETNGERMVALYSSLGEANGWILNAPFSQFFSSGWHLFSKEQLESLDLAISHGVWIPDRTNNSADSSLQINHSELIRLFVVCSSLIAKQAPSPSHAALGQSCNLLDEFAKVCPQEVETDAARIQLRLQQIDLLLQQWSLDSDPQIAFEIADAFKALSNVQWTDDNHYKAEHNMHQWRSKALFSAQAHLQSALESSDWSQAHSILTLLLRHLSTSDIS